MGMYKYPRTYSCGTQTYSLKKVGNIKLSAHFNLKEFQSKDGDDKIIICPDLINKCLEPLFAYMNAKAINITSGYRTPAHSIAIGGAGAKDNHAMGMAADIKVKKQDGSYYSAKEVACALQDMGWNYGIGLMSTSVHVDTGSKYWFDETKKSGGAYVQVADWHQYTGIAAKETTPIIPPVNTPTTNTERIYKYKIGDEVSFTTCYKSSSATITSAIPASKMNKTHGKITKIVNARNPYLLDNGLCWVNDGDISGYYSAPKHTGTAYKITVDVLYVRSGKGKWYKKVGEYHKNEIIYVVYWSGNWAKLESGNWICAKKYCIKA